MEKPFSTAHAWYLLSVTIKLRVTEQHSAAETDPVSAVLCSNVFQ